MKSLDQYWYSRNVVSLLLLPLSWLFRSLAWIRRLSFRYGLRRVYSMPVPVIIIGNISVGGTGKTPLTIWLVKCLQQAGYKPGIVSRGYRGKASHWPQQVRADSDPVMVGDEAVLLAQRCQCPVAVDPQRVVAARALLKYNDCDVIIADDGLQHYALERDIEIAVIDGVRRFGNGRCLPAGPLRESVGRLQSVDFVIVNSGCALDREYRMVTHVGQMCRVSNQSPVAQADVLAYKKVHAVAGIGHPQRFFDQLKGMGFDIIQHAYPDHYEFHQQELDFADGLPVIMTEKDAVKYQRFANDYYWYLPIEAEVDERVASQLLQQLSKITAQKLVN